jgi:hypothetical protein
MSRYNFSIVNTDTGSSTSVKGATLTTVLKCISQFKRTEKDNEPKQVIKKGKRTKIVPADMFNKEPSKNDIIFEAIKEEIKRDLK